MQAAAFTCHIALAERAGQKVLKVHGTMPREAQRHQILCAVVQGFSLNATVRCAMDDRQALEQLCRYITRRAPVNERVQCNAAVQVVVTS